MRGGLGQSDCLVDFSGQREWARVRHLTLAMAIRWRTDRISRSMQMRHLVLLSHEPTWFPSFLPATIDVKRHQKLRFPHRVTACIFSPPDKSPVAVC